MELVRLKKSPFAAFFRGLGATFHPSLSAIRLYPPLHINMNTFLHLYIFPHDQASSATAPESQRLKQQAGDILDWKRAIPPGSSTYLLQQQQVQPRQPSTPSTHQQQQMMREMQQKSSPHPTAPPPAVSYPTNPEPPRQHPGGVKMETQNQISQVRSSFLIQSTPANLEPRQHPDDFYLVLAVLQKSIKNLIRFSENLLDAR